MAPVVLDTFHVPLVNNNDDLFAFALINVSEEIFISLINENFLESWEEDIHALDVPVDEVLIKAFFCEVLWASLVDLGSIHL